MPQRAVCAGQCDRLIYLSRTSLPAGQAMCRACRAERRAERVATCRACGDEFDAKGVRVYCSVVCRGGARSPRGMSRHRVCEVCEAPYVATYAEQRTCGRECGKTIRRPRERRTWPSCRIFTGHCRQCGEAFTARWERPTCSKLCADRLYNAQVRPGPVERQCTDCGVTIAVRRTKCDPCRASSRGDARRRDKHRRRALKRGVASERYTLTEIAKRDRFRCGICREHVDMAMKAPHVMCPSVDHVLPLACGGDDTRANVQLAHWLCNVLKRDQGGGEQLALVG
jgi:hypothetical protein